MALALWQGTADAAEPRCVIDLGSNTTRRIVGSFEAGRYEQRAVDKQPIPVGDDVAARGRISEQTLTLLRQTLGRFKV